MQPRARRSPCVHRTRSHSRPRDAGVIRLRNDPPLRGQWPPRAGSLALRRPYGRLVLGRRPLSCFPSHTPRASNGGDQLTGDKNNGLTARRFPSPPVSFRQHFSVHGRSLSLRKCSHCVIAFAPPAYVASGGSAARIFPARPAGRLQGVRAKIRPGVHARPICPALPPRGRSHGFGPGVPCRRRTGGPCSLPRVSGAARA